MAADILPAASCSNRRSSSTSLLVPAIDPSSLEASKVPSAPTSVTFSISNPGTDEATMWRMALIDLPGRVPNVFSTTDAVGAPVMLRR